MDGRDVLLAFDAGSSEAPEPSYAQPQPQEPANAPPQAAPPDNSNGAQATVSGVTTESNAGGATVAIAIDGNATYEWHRLRDPDNRFWVDIRGAQLQNAPTDEQGTDPIVSLRAPSK